MGILTDLLIADEDDATQIANSQYPLGEFTGIDLKGIDSVKLTMLHSILSGVSWEDLQSQYIPIAEGSDDGPWVFLLPKDLIDNLTKLDQSGVIQIGSQWGKTEEFQLDKWKQEDVITILQKIVQLARQAANQGKRIFMRMSL